MLTPRHLRPVVLLCAALLLVMGWATCAFAQTADPPPSRRLLTGFLAAQTADLGTTCYALSHGFHEANPLVLRRSCGRISLVKLSAVSAELLIARHFWRAHPTAAKAILWTGIAAGTFGATWNIVQLRRGQP